MIDYITLILIAGAFAYYIWSKPEKEGDLAQTISDHLDPLKEVKDELKGVKDKFIVTEALIKSSLQQHKTDSIEEIQRIAASTLAVEKKLSNPSSAGQFGNWQLELFLEKSNLSNEHYRLEKGHEEGRPDAEIDLPGNGKIFIDAKAILQSWVEQFKSADEEEKERLLQQNVTNILRTAKDLSRRDYDKIEGGQAGMVVMFIPLDSILIDFMDRVDKEAISDSLKGYKKTTGERGAPIVFASPATLGGFLGMVGLLWRERNMYDDQTSLLSTIKEFALTLQKSANHMLEGSKHHVKAGDSFRKGYENISKTSIVIDDLRKLTDVTDLEESINNDNYGQVKGKQDLTRERIEAWLIQNPELAKEIQEKNDSNGEDNE